MITELAHEQLEGLAFADFGGATIEQVAAWLYTAEPQFMAALEGDIKVRGLLLPTELASGHLVVRGQHRIAAAYRAGVPVPVTDCGYQRSPAETVEHYKWAALRRSFPGELAAWRRHDRHAWTAMAVGA
jgi:hypothetical protein